MLEASNKFQIDCNHCGKKQVPPRIFIVLFENPRYVTLTDEGAVKIGFHLKAVCSLCGKYIKFLPRTREVIEILNESELLWSKESIE